MPIEYPGIWFATCGTALICTDQPLRAYNVSPVDTRLYDNPGASSLFLIDFTNRSNSDPDLNHAQIQTSTEVQGARWDCLALPEPDLLVIDVEGAEMQVLEGFGEALTEIPFVILETSPVSNFVGGSTFVQVNEDMRQRGFRLVSSDRFGEGSLTTHLGIRSRALVSRLRHPVGPRRYLGMLNVLYALLVGVR